MQGRNFSFKWLLVLLTVVAYFGLVREASAHGTALGCYWISWCQSRWLGWCPSGYAAVDISGDCQGLCNKPDYMECPPFFTRFQCCSAGEARNPRPNTTYCDECAYRVKSDNVWLCCSDCSQPEIVDLEKRIGYCLRGYFNYQPIEEAKPPVHK